MNPEPGLNHDWVGVVLNPATEGVVPASGPYVVLTAYHHSDNAFYELGVVHHEVNAHQLLDHIPTAPPHRCVDADVCWTLDFHTSAGPIDSREVTEQQATALLGCDVREVLAIGRTDHAVWVRAGGS